MAVLTALRTLCLSHALTSEADLSRYRVYAWKDLCLGPFSLRLQVIGESSLVLVRAQCQEWFELVTGGPCEPLPGLARAEVTPAPGHHAALSRSEAGLYYSARLSTHALGTDPFPVPLPHVLEHCFAGPGEPLTRIEAEEGGGRVLLRTRHDYPEAELVVWTESAWELSL